MNYGFDSGDRTQRTKENRVSVFFPLLLAVMLTVGVLLGYQVRPGDSGSYANTDGRRKFDYIMALVKNNYVDTVNEDQVMESAILNFLQELDPHSYYMNPEQARRSMEEVKGNFGGVGIQFLIHKDTLMVTHLVPGGPAQNVGVKAFDRILMVDTLDFVKRKITNEDVTKYLRGKVGTKVKVKIWRRATRELLDFTLERGVIQVSPIDAAVMIDKTTGYIRVRDFLGPVYKDFKLAAEKLLNMGMKTLVLDLRDNGGGLLDQAQLMLDEFLKDDQKMFVTRGRTQPVRTEKARFKGILERTDVMVLVNSNSASASEIVAGAIQDNDRGIIVGRRTFGKGLVQRDFDVSRDQSLVRLTIARYYTPSGRCIQKPYGKGIDYYHDQIDRYNNDEFFKVDSSLMKDSLKYHTIYLKRPVYGGGGIMPDVFVPMDTLHYNNFFRTLMRTRVMNELAFDYVENNRRYVEQFKDEYAFNKGFGNGATLLNEILERAAAKGLNWTPEEKEAAAALIINYTKAEIAQLIYNFDGYALVRMATDDEVKAALQNSRMLEQMRK